MIKMGPQNFNRLRKKIKWFRREEYYGYLTPVEILYLVTNKCGPYLGYSDVDYQEIWNGNIHRIMKHKVKGECKPLFFYFVPSKFIREKFELSEEMHNGK